MRTLIKASWIVGHEAGSHRLVRDGVVVYEGNTIIHVGKSFDGPVDKTIDAAGKLVAPGFIDTHVHSGHRASHRLITDTGRPMYYGQPFLEISVPKEGKVVKGDPRYLKHGDAESQAPSCQSAGTVGAQDRQPPRILRRVRGSRTSRDHPRGRGQDSGEGRHRRRRGRSPVKTVEMNDAADIQSAAVAMPFASGLTCLPAT